MGKQLRLELEFFGDQDDESTPIRYEITSFGADFPVDGIVARLGRKSIVIPNFQRQFIWTLEESSRFIESLIIGLPVPSVFFSEVRGTKKYLVIDGQQRLKSLQFFYNGSFKGSDFELVGVQKRLLGKTYTTLDNDDREALDNALIHTIIVKQEQPDDGDSSIYQIFERLNSTGRVLSPQEIRACVYHGAYNELLVTLSKTLSWRLIFGKRTDVRMKEEELILRFFSLFFHPDKYEKPMKNFLNLRMGENRNCQVHSAELLSRVFEKTVSFVANLIGKNAFRKENGVHTAIFDSVMVAIARRLERGHVEEPQLVRDQYQKLLLDGAFLELIEAGTSDAGNVAKRIAIASKYFDSIK